MNVVIFVECSYGDMITKLGSKKVYASVLGTNNFSLLLFLFMKIDLLLVTRGFIRSW